MLKYKQSLSLWPILALEDVNLSLSLSHLIRYYAKLTFTNILVAKLDVFLVMVAYNMTHFEVVNASTQKDYLFFYKKSNLMLKNYAE